MMEGILVVNTGSSSTKFSVFAIRAEGLELDLRGQIERLASASRLRIQDGDGEIVHERSWPASVHLSHEEGIDKIVEYMRAELAHIRIIGIGHRVVHGGQDFNGPVRVTWEELAALERLIPLAPLHQPGSLVPIRRVLERQPDMPQVACFDTSFHRGKPTVAQLYALPYEYAEQGLLRYGFHGLSYEYIAMVLPGVDAAAAAGRTVALHLGNGASMCAMKQGVSVANTMGFSAASGLVMGTRCGELDPGALLYLMDSRGLNARQIEELIYKQSGLLGISGISSDMRDLLANDGMRAKLAVDLFVYRIGRELGSLAAALGGLDAVVFTGGIGEHSAQVRERVCLDAAWLGLRLNRKANAHHGPRISTARSAVAAWVIPTDEELIIARHTLRLLRETDR